MDVLGCLYSDVERHREQHVQAVQWSTNTAKDSGEGRGEGSQPAEDHRRQNQGSDSGSEAG